MAVAAQRRGGQGLSPREALVEHREQVLEDGEGPWLLLEESLAGGLYIDPVVDEHGRREVLLRAVPD
ncbi:hypothetical protein FHS29_007109 [Saccharothrix tamanrassetensis]|uniref:Uncharacterized protein n=1 Tax=Saccharothrix tamanrassetensis TaxID=1051531 RepID=A0A841CX23_9PSEU|nr:hypothetical protein [Saccharothrix tamanrassetensis]MBB5960485.1 hypothetical protein [Saccharothrix tamanrassetensis]